MDRKPIRSNANPPANAGSDRAGRADNPSGSGASLVNPALRLKVAVEIGMVYLRAGSVANKQYGLEAMLSLLTGSASIADFRSRFRSEGSNWEDGTPLRKEDL